MLTSAKKGETAVHCRDPALSVRVVFHVVSALKSIVCLYTSFLANQVSCRSYVVSVYCMPSVPMIGLRRFTPWAPSSLEDFDLSLYPHNWCTVGHAIAGSFPSFQYYLKFLELFPVLFAARRCGPRWSNKRVCVETDNAQAMTFINKGYCKNPLVVSWLRELFWLSVRYNFHIFSRHLTGQHNIYADRLSHLLDRQMDEWTDGRTDGQIDNLYLSTVRNSSSTLQCPNESYSLFLRIYSVGVGPRKPP